LPNRVGGASVGSMRTLSVFRSRADLEISRDADGLMTLIQDGAAVTFADRDALRVAKAILAAAGYDGISLYRDLGCGCIDVGDDDPPDVQNDELQELIGRRIPAANAPADLFNRGDDMSGPQNNSCSLQINKREWFRGEREELAGKPVVRIARLAPNASGVLRCAGPSLVFAAKHLPGIIIACCRRFSETSPSMTGPLSWKGASDGPQASR
jgi:hypothetical protein